MIKYLRDKAHCKHDAKEDIAVITGSQTITAYETSEEWEATQFDIDYPEGFNPYNCVVIAIGKSNNGETWYEYNYGECRERKWMEVSATLRDSGINIDVSHKTILGEFDLYYKIVLMKIS